MKPLCEPRHVHFKYRPMTLLCLQSILLHYISLLRQAHGHQLLLFSRPDKKSFILAVDGNTIGHLPILKPHGHTYMEEWRKVWKNLGKICRAVVESADMWKDEGKSQVKMRAFSDLLKLLEKYGLSKHKSSLHKVLEKSSFFATKSALIDV